MAAIPHDDIELIDHRNAARAEAQLPLLDVAAEAARLLAVREQVEFEREWVRRRPEFDLQWADRSRGFLSNMGIWNAVRKGLRD